MLTGHHLSCVKQPHISHSHNLMHIVVCMDQLCCKCIALLSLSFYSFLIATSQQPKAPYILRSLSKILSDHSE